MEGVEGRFPNKERKEGEGRRGKDEEGRKEGELVSDLSLFSETCQFFRLEQFARAGVYVG